MYVRYLEDATSLDCMKPSEEEELHAPLNHSKQCEKSDMVSKPEHVGLWRQRFAHSPVCA